MNNKIPKKIHYCWFGKGKKSKLIERCIKSWKKYCPDYEIIEWNETNFDINKNTYLKEAYEVKKWAFVTDYARLLIVYNNGGIYLDTDVELIKPLDDLLEYNAFFSIEGDKYIATGLGFGAVPKNELVKKMLDDYSNLRFIKSNGELDLTPCPIRNTKSIEFYYNMMKDKTKIFIFQNNAFLSSDYFCPYNSTTGQMNKTANTLGIHWYSASWRKNGVNFKRFLLRPIKRMIGIEKFNKIKKYLKD